MQSKAFNENARLRQCFDIFPFYNLPEAGGRGQLKLGQHA